MPDLMRGRSLLVFAVLCLAIVDARGFAHAAGGPFGVITPDAGGSGIGGPFGGFFLQVSLLQQHFYKALTTALSSLTRNPWGVWLLLAVSFAYGVFHAVGPGHGKAVITSYLLASGDTVRRGVLLSFCSALVQAASAILIVGIGAIVLRLTAMQMTYATDWIEILSYGAIALVGAWLLWAKTLLTSPYDVICGNTRASNYPVLKGFLDVSGCLYGVGNESHVDPWVIRVASA